jgi:hypothetical protein
MTLRRAASLLVAVGAVILAGGCLNFHREPPRPGRTTLAAPLVVLPAETIGNYLVVEVRWDRYGPYHFLIDTGASVTLVSPALAKRYPAKNAPPETIAHVRVKSARGDTTVLPAVTLSRIALGDASFENVKVLVYDCQPLSAHLGVRIDGILGFPLFRETLLTLDYPRSRVILTPRQPDALVPGTPVAFNNAHRTPLIPIRVGDQQLIALIDSGSDATLSLNPIGLKLDYASRPRPGVLVGTLTGDHLQEVARLAQPLTIGDYTVNRPIIDLTDELSSLGGGLLKHFTVTFDQEHNRVFFYRDTRAPLTLPPKRTTGLSFTKTPAYWRVASVVPDSPASAAGVQSGDIVSRINGEPIVKWDLRRYERMIAAADEVTYDFLHGTEESARILPVFDLVP